MGHVAGLSGEAASAEGHHLCYASLLTQVWDGQGAGGAARRREGEGRRGRGNRMGGGTQMEREEVATNAATWTE